MFPLKYGGRGERPRSERAKVMNSLLTKLWKEQEGQDLTEYALLLTLIALACIAAMNGLAAAICTVFSNASTQLS
jgi:Flp pilus assembly pilin Flp